MKQAIHNQGAVSVSDALAWASRSITENYQNIRTLNNRNTGVGARPGSSFLGIITGPW